MSQYVKILQSSLNRDMGSRALVETDRSKADEYLVKSKMMNTAKSNSEEINSIKEKLGEIDTLKEDLKDIKNLLNCLVNKVKE